MIALVVIASTTGGVELSAPTVIRPVVVLSVAMG
jgi:hypothetical protein